jgi:glyoxalase family protein
MKRFEAFGIKHDGIQNVLGKKVLPFQEEDGQDYGLPGETPLLPSSDTN